MRRDIDRLDIDVQRLEQSGSLWILGPVVIVKSETVKAYCRYDFSR